MTTYSELVKRFREKNSKPETSWRYESWADSARGAQLAPWDKPQTPWWEEKHEPAPWDEQQVAESGRIYDTRKYFKPGGLVEPGVTHYGKKVKKVKFRRSTLELEKLSLEDL